MSISARLEKASFSLSPLQRIALILQAEHEGREPDSALRRFDDPVQSRAFDRYVALLWSIHYQLGPYLTAVSAYVSVVEDAVERRRLFETSADELDRQLGTKTGRPPRNWREKDVALPVFHRGLALEAREHAASVLQVAWTEFLALKAMWQEMAEEFAGQDVLQADLRENAQDLEARMRLAAAALSLRLSTEPDAENLDKYRSLVDDAFRRLGLVEPSA